jgi:hypothetical protein
MKPDTPRLGRSKMPHVGTTIFTEMSALATECGALNIAQGFPDLETPPALRAAVAAALEAGHNQYAPMAGNRDLRRWIADSYHAGAGYDPDAEITVGAGASSVLFAAMTALLQPGDEVVVQDPGYDLYIPVAELNQAHVVRVPLLDGDGYMNAEGLAKAVGSRTRLVILNSPHNPSGRVTTAAMLDALADAMDGTDVWPRISPGAKPACYRTDDAGRSWRRQDKGMPAEHAYWTVRRQCFSPCGDEREAGARAHLNLGHTYGHALETLTGYGTYLHGEAVSVGLVVALELGAALAASHLDAQTAEPVDEDHLPHSYSLRATAALSIVRIPRYRRSAIR